MGDSLEGNRGGLIAAYCFVMQGRGGTRADLFSLMISHKIQENGMKA